MPIKLLCASTSATCAGVNVDCTPSTFPRSKRLKKSRTKLKKNPPSRAHHRRCAKTNKQTKCARSRYFANDFDTKMSSDTNLKLTLHLCVNTRPSSNARLRYSRGYVARNGAPSAICVPTIAATAPMAVPALVPPTSSY